MSEPAATPLPHLETFAKAAELGSFTAAGQALGLTQAAVSQRIRALERTLDRPLFRRAGGRVLLSDAGRKLHGYARRILSLHDEARREVAGQATPLRGELILAASSLPGEHLLPAFLPSFHDRYPHVQVRVTITDSQAVLRQVEQGQVHLGLVGGRGDSPNLEFRPFACDRMALVVPWKHRLARRKKATLADLLQLPLILREPGSGTRWCLERALKQAGKSIRDLDIVLELGSNEAIKEAIQRGLGSAVLSRQAIEKEQNAKQLRAVDVANLPLERDIFVVWDRRRVLPIPGRLFLDFFEPRVKRVEDTP